MRIGALDSIKIYDLEKINNLYKIIVYAGYKEEYFTFTTPECAKEIDAYLEYRKKRGETISKDSYLIVRKFSQKTEEKGKPFRGMSLYQSLEKCIPRERNLHNQQWTFSNEQSGLSEIFKGLSPFGDGELEALNGLPEGFDIPQMPDAPQEYAPGDLTES